MTENTENTAVKRCAHVCLHTRCWRFERYGKPPYNTTNYLCLGADAARIEPVEAYEALDVPADCPVIDEHKEVQAKKEPSK